MSFFLDYVMNSFVYEFQGNINTGFRLLLMVFILGSKLILFDPFLSTLNQHSSLLQLANNLFNN